MKGGLSRGGEFGGRRKDAGNHLEPSKNGGKLRSNPSLLSFGRRKSEKKIPSPLKALRRFRAKTRRKVRAQNPVGSGRG
jgi:hypothetical protein